MTEEIINLIDCPAIEYIAVGNQYFCKINSCDCTRIRTCGYKRLEQENKALKDNNNHLQAIIDDGRAENKRFREDNRELKAYKDVNEDFKKAWDELNKKYTEVLKLAKENADSNEYCLQELEKENKELKSALEEIRDYAQSQVKHYESTECIEAMCDWQDVVDGINEVLL